MLDAMKTAFKLPELRKKMLWTLLLLAIFRLGSFIVIPGMNPREFGADTIFALLNLFSGGALSNMSLFALGVNPYITASIIMNLLTIVIPRLEELAKEGVEGRKVIAQYTRYGTVLLGLLQATALTMGFRGSMTDPNNPWAFVTVVTVMTGGSVLLMWLGEVISERGIGNGISLLIFAGIISRLLPSSIATIGALGAGGIHPLGFLAFLIIALAVVVFVVIVTEGQRKIPVQYAKRVVGRRMYGGQATHLPLRINQAGVIPVIFASSVLAFPLTIAQFFPNIGGDTFWGRLIFWLSPGQWLHLVLYALFIFIFTYFYTAVTFNPVEVANNMKKYGGFIPGIRPGRSTAEYLDRVLSRITLAGAVFLTGIALLPFIVSGITKMSVGFGGTGLLIVVGVAIDTMKQIEAQLLMRQYEGFLK
ncbi:MAG: preprotein translocase subunit SecY [Firmicutes bacterium]|nr:preprotein translocase subunit SecY [Bacillota bacterium]